MLCGRPSEGRSKAGVRWKCNVCHKMFMSRAASLAHVATHIVCDFEPKAVLVNVESGTTSSTDQRTSCLAQVFQTPSLVENETDSVDNSENSEESDVEVKQKLKTDIIDENKHNRDTYEISESKSVVGQLSVRSRKKNKISERRVEDSEKSEEIDVEERKRVKEHKIDYRKLKRNLGVTKDIKINVEQLTIKNKRKDSTSVRRCFVDERATDVTGYCSERVKQENTNSVVNELTAGVVSLFKSTSIVAKVSPKKEEVSQSVSHKTCDSARTPSKFVVKLMKTESQNCKDKNQHCGADSILSTTTLNNESCIENVKQTTKQGDSIDSSQEPLEGKPHLATPTRITKVSLPVCRESDSGIKSRHEELISLTDICGDSERAPSFPVVKSDEEIRSVEDVHKTAARLRLFEEDLSRSGTPSEPEGTKEDEEEEFTCSVSEPMDIGHNYESKEFSPVESNGECSSTLSAQVEEEIEGIGKHLKLMETIELKNQSLFLDKKIKRIEVENTQGHTACSESDLLESATQSQVKEADGKIKMEEDHDTDSNLEKHEPNQVLREEGTVKEEIVNKDEKREEIIQENRKCLGLDLPEKKEQVAFGMSVKGNQRQTFKLHCKPEIQKNEDNENDDNPVRIKVIKYRGDHFGESSHLTKKLSVNDTNLKSSNDPGQLHNKDTSIQRSERGEQLHNKDTSTQISGRGDYINVTYSSPKIIKDVQVRGQAREVCKSENLSLTSCITDTEIKPADKSISQASMNASGVNEAAKVASVSESLSTTYPEVDEVLNKVKVEKDADSTYSEAILTHLKCEEACVHKHETCTSQSGDVEVPVTKPVTILGSVRENIASSSNVSHQQGSSDLKQIYSSSSKLGISVVSVTQSSPVPKVSGTSEPLQKLPATLTASGQFQNKVSADVFLTEKTSVKDVSAVIKHETEDTATTTVLNASDSHLQTVCANTEDVKPLTTLSWSRTSSVSCVSQSISTSTKNSLVSETNIRAPVTDLSKTHMTSVIPTKTTVSTTTPPKLETHSVIKTEVPPMPGVTAVSVTSVTPSKASLTCVIKPRTSATGPSVCSVVASTRVPRIISVPANLCKTVNVGVNQPLVTSSLIYLHKREGDTSSFIQKRISVAPVTKSSMSQKSVSHSKGFSVAGTLHKISTTTSVKQEKSPHSYVTQSSVTAQIRPSTGSVTQSSSCSPPSESRSRMFSQKFPAVTLAESKNKPVKLEATEVKTHSGTKLSPSGTSVKPESKVRIGFATPHKYYYSSTSTNVTLGAISEDDTKGNSVEATACRVVGKESIMESASKMKPLSCRTKHSTDITDKHISQNEHSLDFLGFTSDAKPTTLQFDVADSMQVKREMHDGESTVGLHREQTRVENMEVRKTEDIGHGQENIPNSGTDNIKTEPLYLNADEFLSDNGNTNKFGKLISKTEILDDQKAGNQFATTYHDAQGVKPSNSSKPTLSNENVVNDGIDVTETKKLDKTCLSSPVAHNIDCKIGQVSRCYERKEIIQGPLPKKSLQSDSVDIHNTKRCTIPNTECPDGENINIKLEIRDTEKFEVQQVRTKKRERESDVSADCSTADGTLGVNTNIIKKVRSADTSYTTKTSEDVYDDGLYKRKGDGEIKLDVKPDIDSDSNVSEVQSVSEKEWLQKMRTGWEQLSSDPRWHRVRRKKKNKELWKVVLAAKATVGSMTVSQRRELASTSVADENKSSTSTDSGRHFSSMEQAGTSFSADPNQAENCGNDTVLSGNRGQNLTGEGTAQTNKLKLQSDVGGSVIHTDTVSLKEVKQEIESPTTEALCNNLLLEDSSSVKPEAAPNVGMQVDPITGMADHLSSVGEEGTTFDEATVMRDPTTFGDLSYYDFH